MSGPDSSILAQLNIRNNVREMQDSMKELQSWEKEMAGKEKALLKQRKSKQQAAVPAIRGRAPAVQAANDPSMHQPNAQLLPAHTHAARSSNADSKAKKKKRSLKELPPQLPRDGTAAGHTYDYFKDRWDKFDLDAALAEADEDTEYESGDEVKPSAAPLEPSAPPEGPAVQPPLPPAEEAEACRSKGNEYFKFGDLSKAKQSYTASIAAQPSATAHANRALVHTKLKEWQQADQDCTAAIELDPAYLKAWQRRAYVHKQEGDMRACLHDLEQALRLAPSSAAISSELRTALQQHMAAQKLRMPTDLTPVPITVVEAPQESDTGAHELVLDMQTKEQPKVPAREPETMKGMSASKSNSAQSGAAVDTTSADPAQVPSTAAADQLTASSARADGSFGVGANSVQASQDAVSEAQMHDATASVALATSTQGGAASAQAPSDGSTGRASSLQDQVSVPARSLRAPTTSAEFEATWRGLKGDREAQVRYLCMLKPAALPQILKRTLTPQLLEAVLDAVLCGMLAPACAASDADVMAAATQLLDGVAQTHRFAMNVMLLPAKRRRELAAQWDSALQSAANGTGHTEMQHVRALYKL